MSQQLMSHGEIHAESEGLGQGATFTVMLPVAAEHAGVGIIAPANVASLHL